MGQSSQSLKESWDVAVPAVVSFLPAGQSLHMVDPVVLVYVPGAQTEQAVEEICVTWLLYVPRGQGVQVGRPAVLA